MKRQRIEEVGLIRAFAILAVLFVHSTSFSTVDLATDHSLYPVYNFLNIFFKFGTPTFIFLSSFVLFYNYAHKPMTFSMIGGFYKKRLLYILIPYVLFSIFYFSLLWFVYYSYTPTEAFHLFLGKLLTGKAYTHLYFVFISIQLYLLFPFILYAVKRFRPLAKHALWIGFLLQWTFVLLNHYYFHIVYKGSLSFSYLSYYFLGIYVGVYFEEVKAFLLSRWRWLLAVLWAGSGALYVTVWQQTRVGGVHYDSKLYELLWNAYTYASCWFLLALAMRIYPSVKNVKKSWVLKIGELSFGIYLIHPFFLFLYRRVTVSPDSWMYHPYVAGGYLFALVASIATVQLVVRYLPFSWMLFGTIKKDKKRT